MKTLSQEQFIIWPKFKPGTLQCKSKMSLIQTTHLATSSFEDLDPKPPDYKNKHKY